MWSQVDSCAVFQDGQAGVRASGRTQGTEERVLFDESF